MSEEIKYMTLGWAVAYCCSKLDQGIDPRNIEVPEIREALDKDIPNDTFEPTIKVSELREWCEEQKEFQSDPIDDIWSDGYLDCVEDLLKKFCEPKDSK